MTFNRQLEMIADEQPDFLIEDEDGVYFPTDDEIDRYMAVDEEH